MISAAVALAACNQPKSNVAELEKLYKKSIDLKDVPTAITAVQMILVQDSTNGLRDSLPELYFAVNNVDACLKTTEDALSRKPEDEDLLQYKLLCLEQLDRLDEQFALSKKLYEKTHKAQYIYKVASVQLLTGNLKDAAETLDTIMDRYKDSKDSIDVFYDQARSQRVPVTAAAWNMRGYMYIQMQQFQKAQEAYVKSVQTYPDFILPRRALQELAAAARQQR